MCVTYFFSLLLFVRFRFSATTCLALLSGLAVDFFVVGSLVFLFSCGAFRFGLLCVLHSSQKNCQHVFNPLPLQVAVPWREVVITRRQEVRKKTAVRFQSFRMPSACAVALVLLCICVAREWSPPQLAMCEGQKGPEEEATPIDPVRCERWGN